MKKRLSVSPLSILMVILVSGVFYSAAMAAVTLPAAISTPKVPVYNAIICGDGELETGEDCDDGNTSNGDGCSSTCEVEIPVGPSVPAGDIGIGDIGIDPNLLNIIICGDGELETGEQCDDGNTFNTDACLNTCINAACGDGFRRAGVEQCDDGNKTSGDGCSSSCNTEVCGNGITDSGEQCDDGNGLNTDSCTNSCNTAVCGDGYLKSGVEDCDDGNTTSGDGCSSSCGTELGPDSDPPYGNVSPMFSGLTVSPGSTFLQYLDIAHDMYLRGKLNPNPSNGAVIIGSGNPDAAFDTGGNLYIHQFIEALDVLARRNVEADQSIIAGNDLETHDDIYLRGASGDSGIIDATDSMVNIFDGLQVNGDIKLQGTSQRIGSYYTMAHLFEISGPMPTEGGYQVTCYGGDVLVSCSAGLEWVETGDRFLGTKIIDVDTCSGRADDLAGNNDNLRVMAMCFDPNGVIAPGIHYGTGYVPT